eukprot:GDKK01041314.1.p1 GENE.GDKK01041314.1~~GDKK01041314.1.p1  ORF type:complete len:116 (-),score=13.91 GDKK01041314.1:32-379(-)
MYIFKKNPRQLPASFREETEMFLYHFEQSNNTCDILNNTEEEKRELDNRFLSADREYLKKQVKKKDEVVKHEYKHRKKRLKSRRFQKRSTVRPRSVLLTHSSNHLFFVPRTKSVI